MDYSVRTVTINEHQLFNISDFVENVERSDEIIKKAGVFKIVLDERTQNQGSPISQFLNVTEKTFRESKGAKKQFLIKYERNPNIYGFRSSNMNFKAKTCSKLKKGDEFLEALNNPAGYKMKTCCSSLLEDKNSLMNHFFNDVVPGLAVGSSITHKPSNHQSVLEQGRKDAKNLQDFLQSMKTLPLSERERLMEQSIENDKRSKELICHCPGCCIDDVRASDQCNPLKWVAYGSATVQVQDHFKISKHFGLYLLPSTSLLRLLPHNYPGITTPFLYYGTTHSFFTAHYEDESLYSFNFLHHGHCKIWVVVPPLAVRKLHNCLASTNLNVHHTTCSNLLGHKYFLLTPKWLDENKIPFTVVVQREKEAVVVSPNAVHFGWNCGNNIAEACNFGNQNWIKYGIVAPRCRCIGGEVHIDMERVIAAARPDLLEVYRNQSIPDVNAAEDPYYYLSILKEKNSHFSLQVDMAKPNPPGTDDVGSREDCQYSYMFPTASKKDGGGKHNLTDDQDVDDPVNSHHSDAFPIASKKYRGRKVTACPKITCRVQYEYGQKKRLYDHVEKVHSKDRRFQKYMKDLAKLFPERNVTKKKQCKLCGNWIAGRALQMLRHQMSSACGGKN